MLDEQNILNQINERAALDFLAEMIRHKSYSETEGERELAAFMVAAMRDLGLQAELQPVAGERVNAIGRYPGTGGGASLLYNGHLDTNPVTGGWTVDPWGGVIDDDFIYGIGVSNMKSGDAAFFSAVRTLVTAGVRLPGDIVLSYVVGELQGGVGTVRAIEQGLKADYFINGEPTDLAALTIHAGAFNFIIELEGETRHISKREEAVDAIAAACALVPRLNAMRFSGAANEVHRSVNRANIGTIRGSLSREFHDWRPPQIADFVRLSGTARYAPSQNQAGVLDDIEAELKQLEAEFPGLTTSVTAEHVASGRPAMLPFEVAEDSTIVTSLKAAYKRLRGVEQISGAVPPPAFYGTDAAHLLHMANMEGVVCGPGGRYNTMPDERVDRVDYLDAVRLYLLLILDICQRKPEV